jgi:hypothetical protein
MRSDNVHPRWWVGLCVLTAVSAAVPAQASEAPLDTQIFAPALAAPMGGAVTNGALA